VYVGGYPTFESGFYRGTMGPSPPVGGPVRFVCRHMRIVRTGLRGLRISGTPRRVIVGGDERVATPRGHGVCITSCAGRGNARDRPGPETPPGPERAKRVKRKRPRRRGKGEAGLRGALWNATVRTKLPRSRTNASKPRCPDAPRYDPAVSANPPHTREPRSTPPVPPPGVRGWRGGKHPLILAAVPTPGTAPWKIQTTILRSRQDATHPPFHLQ
jgi:hypothetical protein